MTKLELIAQIADLKETHYNLTLLLSSLIEILVEKNILTEDNLAKKAFLLDAHAEFDIQRISSHNNIKHQ